MRYLLISLAAFMLFALPAFAYEPPYPPIERQVEVNVDVAAYMEFEVGQLGQFEVVYKDCHCDDPNWEGLIFESYLPYGICVNGFWYVEARFEPIIWDPCMTLWFVGYSTHPILLGEKYQRIAEGKWCIKDEWEFDLHVLWCEKGNYHGILWLILYDP
jgi:hypothetical protein